MSVPLEEEPSESAETSEETLSFAGSATTVTTGASSPPTPAEVSDPATSARGPAWSIAPANPAVANNSIATVAPAMRGDELRLRFSIMAILSFSSVLRLQTPGAAIQSRPGFRPAK